MSCHRLLDRTMSKIVVPYYSASGHTKKLAESILEGIKQVNSDAFLINIEDMIDNSWQQLIEADGIIFGSPTFMGGVAGQYKVFLDNLSYKGFWTGEKMVDKMAGGFTVATYHSGDKLNTLVQLSIFAAQFGMIWVGNSGLGSKVSHSPDNPNPCGSWLGVMATSISDKAQLIGDEDLKTAYHYGVRFSKAVSRWTT